MKNKQKVFDLSLLISVGVLIAGTLLLAALKIFGIKSISWTIVFSPILIPFLILLASVGIIALYKVIIFMIKTLNEE